jgi:hypothetical protein
MIRCAWEPYKKCFWAGTKNSDTNYVVSKKVEHDDLENELSTHYTYTPPNDVSTVGFCYASFT